MVSRIKKLSMAILNPYFMSEKENFIFLNKSVFSQAPLGREGGQFKEVLGRSKKYPH
jgi:hypothetical protein